MTPKDFVRTLKSECMDAAISGCLESYELPPGRAPSQELKKISLWYKSLADNDKENLKMAMADVAHATLFGVFCVFDGVRSITDAENTEIKLSVSCNGLESIIVPSVDDLDLHDIFNAAS